MSRSSPRHRDLGRFLLAVVGGLFFSLICVAAALAPANASCGVISPDRPTLL